MAEGENPPDRRAAERALIELVAEGRAVRDPLGDDALWRVGAAAGTGERSGASLAVAG
jgi:hypothetical protein